MYRCTQGKKKKAPDSHRVTTLQTAASCATQRPLEATRGTTGSNKPTRHVPADPRRAMLPNPLHSMHSIFVIGSCTPQQWVRTRDDCSSSHLRLFVEQNALVGASHAAIFFLETRRGFQIMWILL